MDHRGKSTREIRKYFEQMTKKNQYLWDAAKAVLKGKHIALKVCI